MGLLEVLRRVKRAFVREHNGVKSFEREAEAAGGIAGRHDAGMKIVPARKVVGSVGRWTNLRSDFFYKAGKAVTQRFVRIGRAMEQGKVLPPIEVYKLKLRRGEGMQQRRVTEYYVVDGHHRVAMAKKLGQDFLDAHVVEYQVAGDSSGENAAATAGAEPPAIEAPLTGPGSAPPKTGPGHAPAARSAR